MVSTIKMNWRQYQALGEDPPGVHLELVNGEIAVSPSPTNAHSFCEKQLSRLLGNYVEVHELGLVLGDVDTIFGVHDVRRPDIVFFSETRRHLVGEQRSEGLPDLCVEIISPGSRAIDRVDKFEQYQASGIAYYWIADTLNKALEGYELLNGKYALTGRAAGHESLSLPPFPHFKIELAKIWLRG